MAKMWLTGDMGNLQTLQSLLLSSSLVDPVFVAIDFERPQFIVNGFQHGRLDTQVGLPFLIEGALVRHQNSRLSTSLQEKMHISRNQRLFIAGVLQKKSLPQACYQRLMTAFVSIKTGALFLLGMACQVTLLH